MKERKEEFKEAVLWEKDEEGKIINYNEEGVIRIKDYDLNPIIP